MKVIPQAPGLRERDLGGAQAYELTLAVAKADVAAVKPNADTVEVPARWVGGMSGTAVMRVAHVISDRADPGFWLLGCMRN